MNDIGLGCVVRIFDVSEVLSGAEDFEGKGVEKLSLAEDSMGRFDGKSCFFIEILREFFQLRYFFGHFKLFIHLFHIDQELFTHTFLM